MTLLYVPRKRMSPFSLVLTSPGEDGVPVEIFALQDPRQASRREIQLSFALPPTTCDAQPQQGADDPLMPTKADTQFVGSFAYDVKYSGKEQEKTHQHIAPVSSPLAQATEPDSLMDDRDAASSASTTVLDLYREFERDMDTDIESAAPSNSELRQLVELGSPPRRRPPFREFEFESDVEAETSTTSDSDIEEFVDRNSPLHRQPASPSSLAQAPTLPPRFRKLYAGAAASSFPMRVFDQGADSLDPACRQSSESEGRQPEAPTPHHAPESPSGRLAGFKNFTFGVFSVLCSLWRQLRQISALILRKRTNTL